jgi:hypothetical protein
VEERTLIPSSHHLSFKLWYQNLSDVPSEFTAAAKKKKKKERKSNNSLLR